MYKNEIEFVDKNIIDNNLIRLNTAFNRYISNYSEEQLNQVLKAKENNIYLFLDETFDVESLRFIRSIFAKKNLESFFANYKEKLIDKKLLLYEYKITTTNNYDYIIVEIINKGLSIWNPSVQFITKIAEMKCEKEHTKFEKILSPIYKEIYPLESPESVQKINTNQHEYIMTILKTATHDIKMNLLDIQRRRMKSYDYVSTYREYELKNLYDITCSCMYKMDFKDCLSEQEILAINGLIRRNKYNILLNRKFKEKDKFSL